MQLDLERRLQDRESVPPAEYMQVLAKAEEQYGQHSVTPLASKNSLKPGTYYLAGISDLYQRSYKKA